MFSYVSASGRVEFRTSGRPGGRTFDSTGLKFSPELGIEVIILNVLSNNFYLINCFLPVGSTAHFLSNSAHS